MEDKTNGSCNPTDLSKWRLSQCAAVKIWKDNAILYLSETISVNSDSEFSSSNDVKSKSYLSIMSAIISSPYV
jgi:hypothetical protein